MFRTDFERPLWAAGQTVAGLDEVGTGAWAGPVVAGCVVLPEKLEGVWAEVDDSKKLRPKQREELGEMIWKEARAAAVGWCTVEEIEHHDVLQASLLCMQRALDEVRGRGIEPDHLLVDARRVPSFDGGQTAIVGGDARSLSIAAASIIAKVARDRFMVEQAEHFPDFGFDRHKGYGTAAHREAVRRLGPCPLHRRSFLPDDRQLDLFSAG